MNLEKILKNI